MEFRNWEFLIQSVVREDNKIKVPTRVLDIVATDHMMYGPSIYWNLQNSDRYIILSQAPLQDESYETIGSFQIYEMQAMSADTGRIRPPKDVEEYWSVTPTPGDRVFFLSHQKMCQGETPSVYLLSEEQVLSLLPNQTRQAGATNEPFSDTIFEVPALHENDNQ